MPRTVADHLAPVIRTLLGDDPEAHIRFWDGSHIGGVDAPVTLDLRSPRVLRRLLFAPGELGLSRAYVAGDADVRGSIFGLLDLRERIADRDPSVSLELDPLTILRLGVAAVRLGVVGLPPRPPKEEARVHGLLHSKLRDRKAISHHYDVGNDFYRLVLGESMTYSCAYFPSDTMTLDQAQAAKHELICRKLDLRPGMRLLDVGCGWGTLAIHAARHHGASVVGVTISREQAARARDRVAAAGLSDQVQIRLQDYRDIDDGPYDAIASVGMFEHVGLNRLRTYVTHLRDLLAEEGRLLNHAISRTGGEGALDRNSFVARYVFPDGELQEVGRVISAMQDVGLECRDVESLREHYALTLRHWVDNLEANWEEAVGLAGAARARIWRLYMAGSAIAFEGHRINIHQVLATRTSDEGDSGMPRTRASFAAVTAPPDLSLGRRAAPSPSRDRVH